MQWSVDGRSVSSTISLFYSDCFFTNLKRCLWAINCLRIYYHLQPPKTTSRNLQKVKVPMGTTQCGDAILGALVAQLVEIGLSCGKSTESQSKYQWVPLSVETPYWAHWWLSWLRSGCHAGGREFDSGRTNSHSLKITE